MTMTQTEVDYYQARQQRLLDLAARLEAEGHRADARKIRVDAMLAGNTAERFAKRLPRI